MELLMHRSSPANYSLDTAHTIEVTREEDENGEFGSFGFTLLYEKPPIVGTIVPGGPAQRAGLKKDDIVLTVNGFDVTIVDHQKVVNIISQTATAGVWLKVCDPDTKSPSNLGNRNLGSMSSSTPNFPRGLPSGGSQRKMRGMGGAVWEPPPKYSEVPPSSRSRPGSGGVVPGTQLGSRGGGAVSGSVASMSPLNRHVLMPHQKSGLHVSALGGSGPLPQNGYGSSPPRLLPAHQSSDNCYTSASVMVLYIGPVEIPETWSMRGISSKCIQECTRRLLSQRQEFIEAFLEVSTSVMKVLNVSRNVLYQHKREELFYCGTCTDDEQYFAIVTRKIDPKLVDPEVGQTLHVPVERPVKANICHVFQVIRNKSILILHAGDKGGEVTNIKPKTVQILSCLTIIKAIEALFIGEATGGAISSAQLISESNMNSSSNTSFRSIGSSESNGSSESFPTHGASPDKQKKKKDVVDLRPVAFNKLHTSSTYASGAAVGSVYITHDGVQRNREHIHVMDTPAYNAMSATTTRSWYKVDSPKEGGGGGGSHSRQGSYELGLRPENYYDMRYTVAPPRQQQEEDTRRAAAAFDKVKKISDESSISSHSSGGGGGGNISPSSKLSLHPNRGSHSPSPSKSLSYSSGSRSRSPSPSHGRYGHTHHTHHTRHYPKHQQPQYHQPTTAYYTSTSSASRRRMMMTHRTPPSKLSAGMALEVGSLRSGALSPTSTVGSVSSRYRSTLRRQGSESSIMDLHQVDTMRSGGGGLPPKNSLLTSSHGSIMTVTTVAEEDDGKGPEEVGRVGGWIASFDKLLEDPLGIICLQQFLEKEHCEENILFWKDASEFTKNSFKMSAMQIQAAAKKIYDQYLSPSSPHTVNVDDRAIKGVETRLSNPVPNIFAEAQEQIYQLLKMDCYMRFKRSDLVKECLLADMEGDPLPIGPATPITKNPWKKQKDLGFSRSLFGRFVRKAPPSPPLPHGAVPNKTKKDSKASLKDSPGSRKTSRDTGFEKKRSSSEMARAEDFPPAKHLDILQAHKGNIFEVNLPNKVTKIMEVPKKGSVREAIQPVLKKNNYSLDVIDLKFADTLKAVSLDSPAHILIGQHIVVLKSPQTFIATFPTGPERILPAGKMAVQELIAGVLNELGTLQNFAVYLENSRVPFNGTIEASTLVGQKVTVKYLGGQYVVSDNNMEDLMCMIERLAGDTLEDQRTSPTPRNTPEPTSSPSSSQPPEVQQKTRGNSFRRRLSPRSSDSSPETRGKTVGGRQRSGSAREKKTLTVSRSIGQVTSAADHKSSSGQKEESSSRRFKRTQSGAVISRRKQQPPEMKRTYSPPTNSDRKLATSPPPPTSRPPPLPPSFQQYNRAHRSNEELLHEASGVVGSQTPTLSPRAYPSIDNSIGNTAYGSSNPESLNRGGRGYSPLNPHRSNEDHHHPLDSFVKEASVTLPSGQPTTTSNSHGRQHSMPVAMPPDSYNNWKHTEQPLNPRRYIQQHSQRTAAHRHNLTRNPELMRTGDQLVQREIDDYRQQQLTSSHSSYSDTSSTSATAIDQPHPLPPSRPRLALSPTTHVLLVPDDTDQTETFV